MKQGKTIFIDDSPINLEDMNNVYPDVVSLDRLSFKNWKELL